MYRRQDTHKYPRRYAVCAEAIADAGGSRIEPIILTKLCTVFGLLPIAISDTVRCRDSLFQYGFRMFEIPLIWYTPHAVFMTISPMRILRYISRFIVPKNILFLSIGVFICFFTFVAFSRHSNFHSRRLDLGNMEQVVWNVSHGNGFTLTDPMGDRQQSRLAVHADFLLIALAPFYLLWQDPRMLLLVQTIVMGLGAVPVFWLATHILKSERIALVFGLMYLLYPPLQRMTLHDFHAVALSTTFLLFAYWFMETKRYGWFLLLGLLAALGKETEWVTFGLMGGYIAFRQKKYVFGVSVLALGFAMFYYLYWYAMPAAVISGNHFALGYLSDFGDSQNNIVLGLLEKPWMVLTTLFSSTRLYYYLQLLLPVGFLPLLSPMPLFLAVHTLLINALSSNSLMRQIDYQYTSGITPFIFVSAIYGFSRMKTYFKRKTFVGIWIVLFCVVGVTTYMWGEIPLTNQDRYYFFIWSIPEKQSMMKVREIIGTSSSVSVTNNIGSHFSNRETLYNFPINATSADYSVVLLGDQYAWPSGDAQAEMVKTLLNSPDYTLMLRDGDFYAFERNHL